MAEEKMSLIEQLENPPRVDGGHLDEDKVIDLMRTAAFAFSTMVGVASKACGHQGLAAKFSIEELTEAQIAFGVATTQTEVGANRRWDAIKLVSEFLGRLRSTLSMQTGD